MSGKAQDTDEKKKGKLPSPLLLGLLLFLVGMLVGKSVLGSRPVERTKKSAQAIVSNTSRQGKYEAATPQELDDVGRSVSLDEFLVNLTGGSHYLRTTITLGLRKGLNDGRAKDNIPAMRDAILTVLSEKTLKDLSSTQGRETLKAELIRKVNDVLGEEDEEEPVVKIYFTAFATQ